MVIDDSLVITGSANMDVRSFEHNFEIDAFIYCPETARQVKSIFLADLEHCEPVISAQWRKRAIGRKMFESLMRLFTPLL
jgi:cardiolipin synthase